MPWSVVMLFWTVATAGAEPPASSTEPAPSEAPAIPETPAAKVVESREALAPLATWPRMRSVDFGCMLARAGGEVDPAWACGASQPPDGDPCEDTENYYAGPEFPASLLPELPGAVTGVSLSWERGSLREVILFLAPSVDEAGARGLLPSDKPDNVRSVDVQKCHKDHLCASLTGFPHTGAGDVDCED